MTKHVWRYPPLLQRRTPRGAQRDVFGEKILHAVSTQTVAPGTRKHCRVSPVRDLAQPSLQNRYGLLGQRGSAFLAALSKHSDVGAHTQSHGVAPHAGEFGQAQPALNGDQEKGVIAASGPRVLIGSSKQGLNFRSCQEADLSARKSLAGYGQDTLDLF